MNDNPEKKRLDEAREQKVPWKKWGPYLSERQWGLSARTTVRTGMPGTTSPMTRPVPGLPLGEDGLAGSPTTIRCSALPLRSGTS